MLSQMSPRQYATEALKKETRREAWDYVVDNAPAIYHDLISKYLKMWWGKRKEVLASVQRQKEKMADLRR